MICPIMSNGDYTIEDCSEGCALYDKENKQCILLTMGKALEKISKKVNVSVAK